MSLLTAGELDSTALKAAQSLPNQKILQIFFFFFSYKSNSKSHSFISNRRNGLMFSWTSELSISNRYSRKTLKKRNWNKIIFFNCMETIICAPFQICSVYVHSNSDKHVIFCNHPMLTWFGFLRPHLEIMSCAHENVIHLFYKKNPLSSTYVYYSMISFIVRQLHWLFYQHSHFDSKPNSLLLPENVCTDIFKNQKWKIY